ncbi:FAD-dependent oxidoreductase [Streptomyces sp. HUAS MG47]|uniref:FAD-dependent oxidoreductase n=1 Tax=Streptomyces solicamelliae TaxID=3231716 RepID=UPI0038779F3F
MGQIARFLRSRVPGFAESYVLQSGVQVGVRKTRRIAGEYQLTGHDVLSARSFDDAIARGAYPVGVHHAPGLRPCGNQACRRELRLPMKRR